MNGIIVLHNAAWHSCVAVRGCQRLHVSCLDVVLKTTLPGKAQSAPHRGPSEIMGTARLEVVKSWLSWAAAACLVCVGSGDGRSLSHESWLAPGLRGPRGLGPVNLALLPTPHLIRGHKA